VTKEKKEKKRKGNEQKTYNNGENIGEDKRIKKKKKKTSLNKHLRNLPKRGDRGDPLFVGTIRKKEKEVKAQKKKKVAAPRHH